MGALYGRCTHMGAFSINRDSPAMGQVIRGQIRAKLYWSQRSKTYIEYLRLSI